MPSKLRIDYYIAIFETTNYQPEYLRKPAMNIEDILYFSSLFVCISLGSYYKKIQDTEMKRNYGAGLGLLVGCLICGQDIFHSAIIVWGNVIIIKCCDKRYIHILSLVYTWIYLTFLHYNYYKSPAYFMWFYQCLALRVVGLSFEVFLTEKARVAELKGGDRSALALKLPTVNESDLLSSEPSATSIITYAYFFIGIHKGPYYRWKVFDEHFNAPFGTLGDCRIITIQKLKKATLCALGYAFLYLTFDPEMYQMEDFYTKYGSDFRYLYGVPLLMMHFLKYQVIMMLCTSVCTETGFGVYPAKTIPLPGHGASTSLNLLNPATAESALDQEYNFSMLKCFDNRKLIIGPKMKDTIRAWDMPTRYWFWAYTYKFMLKANKEVRSAASFLAWTVWRGLYPSQLIISATTWVYVHLEAEYTELYDTSGSMKGAWDIGFGIMRILYLIYLTPCLVIRDTHVVFRFYTSIFWVYHFLLFFLMILAVFIFKCRKPPAASTSQSALTPANTDNEGKSPNAATHISSTNVLPRNQPSNTTIRTPPSSTTVRTPASNTNVRAPPSNTAVRTPPLNTNVRTLPSNTNEPK